MISLVKSICMWHSCILHTTGCLLPGSCSLQRGAWWAICMPILTLSNIMIGHLQPEHGTKTNTWNIYDIYRNIMYAYIMYNVYVQIWYTYINFYKIYLNISSITLSNYIKVVLKLLPALWFQVYPSLAFPMSIHFWNLADGPPTMPKIETDVVKTQTHAR